jgi:predicted permease
MFWRRRRTPDDFAAEVRSHLELETERLVSEGHGPEAARAAARRRFGNETRVHERFYESTHPMWLDHLRVDVRAAARGIRRYPVAAMVAVISLGGGIGAATATLALRDTLFTLPPPLYAQPDALSVVRVNDPRRPFRAVSPPLYRAWADTPALAGRLAAATRARPVDARLDDRQETVSVRAVTANLFAVLGVQPILGRSFDTTLADDDEGRAPAVLSHRMWRALFDARAEVLGATIWIDGRAHTVIGVLPEHFWFAQLDQPIWTLADSAALAPEVPLDVVVRRDADTSPTALCDRLQAIAAEYVRGLPGTDRDLAVQVRDAGGTPIGEAMGAIPLFLVGAAVLLTVVIGATNVAILMMAQWTSRDHEIAVRASLGASRLRIVRALVAESALIALAGGALGVCVTLALRGLIVRNGGEFAAFNLSIRPAVFLGAAVITIVVGIVTGLVPALVQTRLSAYSPLTRLRVGDGVRQRWRHALVAFEISVTVALLVLVGTLVSASQRTFNADLGFDAAPILRVHVQNANGIDVAGVVARMSGLPGAVSAAASTSVPLGSTGPQQRIAIDATGSNGAAAERAVVGPGFFATLGVPLRAGRDFAADERTADARSVLVSEALASRLWPGLDAVGRDLWIEGQAHTVVGVVAAYASRTLQPARPVFYLPLVEACPTDMSFVIRAEGRPGLLREAVRREIVALASGHVVSGALTLQEIMQVGGKELFITTLPLAPLASIAMLLTAAGVYGVLAFAVSRRAHELAVRVAIGAGRTDVVRLVAGHSLRVVFAGLAGGIGTTLALTRLTQGTGGVFDSPGWAAFVVPALVVLVVAALATWVPLRRAVGIDPVRVLRMT